MIKNTLIFLLYFFILSINVHSCVYLKQETKEFDTTRFCNEISSLKISKEQLEKIKKYVNNPLGWSALNYSIQEKDYDAALIIADYTTNINQKDSLYSFKESHIKYNALSRLLHRAYHSWLYDNLDHSQRQINLDDAQLDLAHKLIDRGIELDEIDSSSFTPICYSVFLREKDLVARLIEKGANINIRWGTWGGEILLSHAVAFGQTDLVHYLIDQGANIQLIDKPGHNSILHSAILSQKQELVELALNYGCDISQLDAVSIAISYTRVEIRNLDENLCTRLPALEMVQFLLEHGANPNFWVFEWLDKQEDFQKALRYSPVGKALNLLDHPPTCYQNLYQQLLIKLLQNYGAIMP